MKIGFDAKRAFLNYTGLGNYSRVVIGHLSERFPSENYFLYTTKAPRHNRTDIFFDRENICIKTPNIPVLKSLWRSRFITSQLKKDKLDIYHGLSNEIPSGISATGIRSVVTIHDLIFLRYPEYYKSADRKIYEYKFRYACKHANKIIAISEQTKRDIISFFKTDASKIEVVYQGCDPVFSRKSVIADLERIKEQYRLPERFLLSVGTVEKRKNVLLAVKALEQIQEEIKLVIIGRHTEYTSEIKKYMADHQLQSRVVFLDNVAFSDLPGIYQQAEIFIYPSRFEGFGLPVTEALHSGVPVIAATGSCLEEAGGPGSIYVPPDDVAAMVAAIKKVIGNDELKKNMIAAGHSYAASITNENMSTRLMEVYKSLI